MFVRAGVFVKHHPTTQQRQLAAQPAHVLFMKRGEAFRTSHPSSRGDSCTVIAYDTATVHEVSVKYAPTSALVDTSPFPAAHAVVSPSAVLRLQQLRQRLRTTPVLVSSAQADAEALGLLHIVLEAAWTQFHEGSHDVYHHSSLRQREIVETVKEALARHPAAATSLHDLATYIGISPFYLARTFRREAGLPIHQYLLRLRLGTALERMSDPSVRLSAIALDAGFSSPSHFTSAFRRAFGVAPTEWKSNTSEEQHRQAATPRTADHVTDAVAGCHASTCSQQCA
ncbi:MAG: AraC family transcriptional regulator [Gemmatimonadota bacterium]|nr:AraC family transcriptional regulator [Gemmatimonadota bacterium]